MARKPMKETGPISMPPVTLESLADTEGPVEEGKFRVYVQRATWIGTERQEIGTALDVPVADAIAGIENGYFSRNPVDGA